MRSRLPLPDPARLDDAQRSVLDDVLRTRGNASGPFLAWLHSPGLADPAQKLGAFCRYGTSLSLAESELLILMVAAAYGCEGERAIHEPIARRSGLPPELFDAVCDGRTPWWPTARLRALGTVAGELLATRRLAPATLDDAVSTFGEATLVEIVGVIGYYALVAYTLNAFDMTPGEPSGAGGPAPG